MTSRDWRRLLEVLGAHGRVSESVAGQVTWEHDGSSVQIVMTPDDWSGWSRTVMGDVNHTANLVLADARDAVAQGTPYLVFDTYELHPSHTTDSPVRLEMEAEERRVAEYLRDHPDARGEWRAYSPGHEPDGGRTSKPDRP